ncbi:MAG: flagellar biosynthetic protein FliO [Geminicoccaceae bacterium]
MAIDNLDLIRTLAALALVLGVILLLAWAARRYLPSLDGQAAGRRLAIVESRAIDPRNRLVLVRHDDREHLLVVGANGTTLVSGDLPRAGGDEPPLAANAQTERR